MNSSFIQRALGASIDTEVRNIMQVWRTGVPGPTPVSICLGSQNLHCWAILEYPKASIQCHLCMAWADKGNISEN